MALAPPRPGLRAVPLRPGTDTLVRVGWVLLLMGLCWPWIREGHCCCSWWRRHGLSWILDDLHLELLHAIDRTTDAEIQWWWSLPLVYGFVLPALWCSRYRHHTGFRLVAGWAWLVGLFGVLSWARSCVPFDWDEFRSIATCLAEPSPRCGPRSLRLDHGFFFSAAGALLVGACPVIELQRLRRTLARWRTRPGRAQARQAIDPHGLLRLYHPVRRLVCEARELRANLSPFRPIEGEPSRMLVELVGRLRSLDDQGRAELRDHGVCAGALLGALAPEELRRETSLEEALRVDAALTELEAVGLRKGGVAPYR
jgi:hypothetical protein